MQLTVTSDADLACLIGRLESDSLEFKGDAWANAEECAKDVAALGNADGGQILIGVVEGVGTSVASGFRDWLAGRGEQVEQQRIHQWLVHALRPRDFVDRISYRWLTAPTRERVLSLEVQPSIGSCVAVASGPIAHGKLSRFQFPMRTNKETRFMDHDEVIRRMADRGRAISLRLKELSVTGPAQRFVRVASPIVKITSAGPRDLVRDPTVRTDASLGEQHAEGFVITFCGNYRWGAAGLPEDLTGRAVLVPYALVRTIWNDALGNLCVALDGRIEVFGDQLQVTTG